MGKIQLNDSYMFVISIFSNKLFDTLFLQECITNANVELNALQSSNVASKKKRVVPVKPPKVRF